MIVPLEQLPPVSARPMRLRLAWPANPSAEAVRAPLGLCCAALGFLCFMPYPALRVGNASAVQGGNVLVLLLAAAALMVSWKGKPFWVFPVLAAPLFVSVLKAALAGQGGLDVSLKSLPVWTLSCMAILATQLCAPRYAVHLLAGIAAAILVHAAVGAWQVYAFARGEFPFSGLYVNPSFLSVQDNASIIARYIRRPFGVFPEPSAMAASIAPWVLFLFAAGSGAVRLRTETGPRHRLLFLAASVAGLGLIIVSRSGHAAVTSLAFAVLVAAWFMRARATPRNLVAVTAGLGVFLPAVLYFAAVSVGERLGGKSALGTSSWAERAASLRAGFDVVASSDSATHFFGMGVGQASPALQASAGLDAVFSVLLTYVFETGLLGALALVFVAHLVLRAWRATRFDLTFALVAGVWLVGVTLITSYEQLLPPWMALGWLTAWPAVCRQAGPGVASPAPVAAPAVSGRRLRFDAERGRE